MVKPKRNLFCKAPQVDSNDEPDMRTMEISRWKSNIKVPTDLVSGTSFLVHRRFFSSLHMAEGGREFSEVFFMRA